MRTTKINAPWLGAVTLAMALAGPAWSQADGAGAPAKPALAASAAFQDLVQQAGPAGRDLAAGAAVTPVKGSPVETGGQGGAVPVVQPPAERLVAYVRTLQSILKAYKHEWLNEEDWTLVFIVPKEDLPAYESLRKKLNFLREADEDGFVMVRFYALGDDKIEHVRAMKKYFYAVMRSIADGNGLEGDARKIALWARETIFTWRLRKDPAKVPDRRIEILTESEYEDLTQPRK